MLIAHLKARNRAHHLLKNLSGLYACHVTVITVYELLFGIARTRKPVRRHFWIS